MSKLNTERIKNIAFVVAGTAVVVGTAAVVVHIRRRKRRFLPVGTRQILEQVVGAHAENLATTGVGSKVESLFERRLGGFSDKQLIAIFAAVHVGAFIKQAGIDPRHPDPASIAQAAREYTKAEFAAPETRKALLDALKDMGPTIVKTALRAVLDVMG